MLVKITQKTTMNGCHIRLIRICSCNCLSLCSSCTLNLHHIWTNKLLCHVQAISGKWSNLWTGVLCNINSRTRFNFTCCIQSNSHRVWFLEPILLPPSHFTILCEPITRSQKLQPILHNFDARHLYLN